MMKRSQLRLAIPRSVGMPGLALLPAVLLAACAQPARYGGARYGVPGYDFPIPYDGTDPAAQAQSRFTPGRAFGFRPRSAPNAESSVGNTAPTRFYPPPGTTSDPWGPYIQEAAQRFRVPEQWVRAVMHQESGGQEQVVSSAGAMGLMQVMPATYAGLRGRYALGVDPFDPHNNVMAGVAYIREMYDRFGSPGFLAAYNAGPDRLDAYLTGGVSLPDETVNYLASITPHLGTQVAMSGPLAQYASAASPARSPDPFTAPTAASFAAGCDPNAAYDPDQPCAPLLAVSFTPDPPVAQAPPSAMAPLPLPSRAFGLPLPNPPADGSHGWSIQVGAFNNPVLARVVAEGARSEAPAQLGSAVLEFPTLVSSGTKLYRARLTNLSASGASSACALLTRRQLPCVVVTPGQTQTS